MVALCLGVSLRLRGSGELRAERLEHFLLLGREVVAEQRAELLGRESLDGLPAQTSALGLALLECGSGACELLAQRLEFGVVVAGGCVGRGPELVGEAECLAPCGGAGCGLAQLLELGLARLRVAGCGGLGQARDTICFFIYLFAICII